MREILGQLKVAVLKELGRNMVESISEFSIVGLTVGDVGAYHGAREAQAICQNRASLQGGEMANRENTGK